MKKTEIIDQSRKFAEPYCITNGKNFRLKDIDPGDTGDAASADKPRAKELLAKQRIPQQLITEDIWDERYRDIRHVEHYLSRNGVVIRKFFLHVSADEQKKRFLERLDNSAKNWKFSATDSRERGFWKEYMKAYEDMIRNTATDCAPWYVVPADNKWFTRVVVAAVVVDALASLNLQYPEVSAEQHKQLALAKEALIADDERGIRTGSGKP